MNVKLQLELLCQKHGISLNELIIRHNHCFLNKMTYSNIYRKLKNKTIRYEEVEELIAMLDYRLAWLNYNNEEFEPIKTYYI